MFRKASRRVIAALAVSVSLSAVAASGAAAWTFATTDSPLKVVASGVTQGAAVGYVYRSGYNDVYLEAAVRDYVTGDGDGIYARGEAWKRQSLAMASTSPTYTNAWTWKPKQKMFFGAHLGGAVGVSGKGEVCEEVDWRWDRCVSSASRAL